MSASAPRFVVSGYYGFGNAGDEAMLAGLIEGFRELSPAAELTVLSGNSADTTAEHGVPAVPRDLRSVRRQVALSDVVVSGGGGLLQDATSWGSALYYLAAIQLAKSARKPVAFIGQSIGPLRRRWVRLLVRRALSRVEALSVRDELSRTALVQLGLSREVTVTADLGFLVPKPTEADIAAALSKAGLSEERGPLAAIALRHTPRSGAELNVARVAGAVGGACESAGIRPLLIPMQASQDVELARDFAAALPSGSAIIAPPMRAREIMALVAGCQMVIAMRLHALVFAALCGVPPVGISYDPKVDGLMEQLGLAPATSVDRFDAARLGRAITEAWGQREGTRAMLAARAPDLRSLALRNIELALSLLPRR